MDVILAGSNVMEVLIHHEKGAITAADETVIRERIEFAVGRLGHRIRTVRARIEDLNGPKGGIDKCCIMEAVLARLGSLVVTVRDADAIAASGEAAKRLARRVTDASKRTRDLRRRANAGTSATPYTVNHGGDQ